MLSCLKKYIYIYLVTWLKIHRQLGKVRGGSDQFRNWEAGKSFLWSHCTAGNSWYSNSYSFWKEKMLSRYLLSQQKAHSMVGLVLGASLLPMSSVPHRGWQHTLCYKAQGNYELQILHCSATRVTEVLIPKSCAIEPRPRRCCPQCQQWSFDFHKYFHSYHWYKHS